MEHGDPFPLTKARKTYENVFEIREFEDLNFPKCLSFLLFPNLRTPIVFTIPLSSQPP